MGEPAVTTAARPGGHPGDDLPSWRETPAKRAILEFVAAVTDPGSPDVVPERERVAVFDNDGTLWTEQPAYAQLVFALDRAAELGRPTSIDELRAGGMPALMELLALTHAGITTDEFDAACRSLAGDRAAPAVRAALPGDRLPADARAPHPARPARLRLLDLLRRRHRLHAHLGRRGLRSAAEPGHRQRRRDHVPPPARARPELVKTTEVRIVDDGPLKPSSIHQHVGQRPIMAAGNTDGDLAMLQWTAGSPHRTLELVVRHTDADREYAYDRDPILAAAPRSCSRRPPTTAGPSSTWPPTGPPSTP